MRTGNPPATLPRWPTALRQAVDAGATVVNVSGAVCLSAAAAAAAGAPVRAALRAAAAADVVVVAAAGNAGSGGCAADRPDLVSLPGWYGDDVLTVGAVGPDDRPAEFTVPGPWVDVAAPGTGVRSLTVDGGTGAPLDGTSFAAPLVAGLAALIRERRPDLGAREVIGRITTTARRPPAGRDDAVGAGVVDVVAALTAEARTSGATHRDHGRAGPARTRPGSGGGVAARGPRTLLRCHRRGRLARSRRGPRRRARTS